MNSYSPFNYIMTCWKKSSTVYMVAHIPKLMCLSTSHSFCFPCMLSEINKLHRYKYQWKKLRENFWWTHIQCVFMKFNAIYSAQLLHLIGVAARNITFFLHHTSFGLTLIDFNHGSNATVLV